MSAFAKRLSIKATAPDSAPHVFLDEFFGSMVPRIVEDAVHVQIDAAKYFIDAVDGFRFIHRTIPGQASADGLRRDVLEDSLGGFP
jgi:hypothetical protein